MKTFLFFLGVVTLGVFVSGQAATAPGIRGTADSIQKVGDRTYQFRGHVQLEAGSLILSADEADVTTGANGSSEVDLRGNVHVTVPPGLSK